MSDPLELLKPSTWGARRPGRRPLAPVAACSSLRRERPTARWGRAAGRLAGGLLPLLLPLPLPLLLPLLVLGCGGTDLSPGQPLEDVAWRLELNHHAVLLSTTAPWDTLPLTATPVNYRGDTLEGLPAPQFSSNDIEHVRVTPDGVLHAVAPTAGGTVQVIVTLAANNVRNADTVYVRVMETTNPPPVLHSFSIHPLPGDSAKRAAAISFELPALFAAPALLTARATDPDGNTIPNVPVYYRSSDNTIAMIALDENRTFAGIQPGAVTFYASTTVFGVTKADTLPYRIGQRVLAAVSLQRIVPTDGGAVRYEFVPSEVTVGTGALVSFTSQEAQDTALTDVVFTEADLPNVVAPTGLPGFLPGSFFNFICSVGVAECNNGNFVYGPSPNPVLVFRVFTQPGTYEYHSPGLGASGRIVVVDER